MMEAEQASETLVSSYQSMLRYNPEGSHLHNHCHENLRSYLDEGYLAVYKSYFSPIFEEVYNVYFVFVCNRASADQCKPKLI
jgi:hypothetical protein